MGLQNDADERLLTVIKSNIKNRTSLDCDQFKDNYLKRRIKVRMRNRRLNTYEDYYLLLSRDPNEYQMLMNDITINVTQFFRDPEVFDKLEEEILPLMIFQKVKENRRVIRIWSAGCASGEEVYSMAILMRELLGDDFDEFLLSIHGTDIDENSLKIARMGKYHPQQMNSIKQEYLEKYFDFDGENYIVKEELKDITRFKKSDLFSEGNGEHFDIILCRNVMIYFTKEMQNTLFKKFYDSLNRDGFLIIGKTEMIIGDNDFKFSVYDVKERIYHKKIRKNSSD